MKLSAIHWVMSTVAVLALVNAAWAGDAWKTKKPAEWSEKEMHKFMTNSPWTRTVQPSMNQMSMDHGPTSANTGGWGGGPGGGGGGWSGGGGGNMGGTAPITTFQVRWASAPTMREALKLSASEMLNAAIARYEKDYYIVSVTMHVEGAAGAGGKRGGWGGGGGRGQWGPPGGQGASPEKQEEFRKQFEQMLIKGAMLRVAGQSVHPEKAEMTPSKEGMTTLYMFPRTLKLEVIEKDFVFELTQGPSVTRANFSFKGLEQSPEKGL